MAFTKVLGPGIHTLSNITSHNLHSSGIITAVSFVGDGSGLTGVASTDNIVTGSAATFTGGVDINSDLDVDGHTNLDNVSIAGVTTFAGGLTGTTANFSGDVIVGGVLTYEDVKNVDSVGLITARNGINVSGGNVTIANDIDVDGHTNLDNVNVVGVVTASAGFRVPDGNYNTNLIGLGNHEDFIIYHDTAHTYAENKVGDFRLKANTIKIQSRTHGETFIQAALNGAVEVYYDGSKKFETSEKGIQVGTGVTIETNGQATYTGIITATAFKLADGSAIGAGAGGTWSTYTAGIATSKSVGVNTSTLDDNDLVGVGNSFQGLYISNGMMITDNSLHGNHYIGTAFNGLMAGPVSIEGTLTIDGNYVVV